MLKFGHFFGVLITRQPCRNLCILTMRSNPALNKPNEVMRLKVIVHEAEEGGFWAEVPSISGCVTQGETFDELLGNIYEAVEGCLSK